MTKKTLTKINTTEFPIEKVSPENIQANQKTHDILEESFVQKVLTIVGFFLMWGFWLGSACGTFLALQFVLGSVGGGVLGKSKVEILDHKVPAKDVISLIFAGVIEVGSLTAIYISKKEENNDD